jgi:hypothetical protein
MDECKILLQKMLDELVAIKEAQVFIVANLFQIKTELGE